MRHLVRYNYTRIIHRDLVSLIESPAVCDVTPFTKEKTPIIHSIHADDDNDTVGSGEGISTFRIATRKERKSIRWERKGTQEDRTQRKEIWKERGTRKTVNLLNEQEKIFLLTAFFLLEKIHERNRTNKMNFYYG